MKIVFGNLWYPWIPVCVLAYQTKAAPPPDNDHNNINNRIGYSAMPLNRTA